MGMVEQIYEKLLVATSIATSPGVGLYFGIILIASALFLPLLVRSNRSKFAGAAVVVVFMVSLYSIAGLKKSSAEDRKSPCPPDASVDDGNVFDHSIVGILVGPGAKECATNNHFKDTQYGIIRGGMPASPPATR